MQTIADLPVVNPNEGLASDALERGLLETGFFYLRDHAIPLEMLHELRRETYAFFALPEDEKTRYRSDSRGYAALREEHLSAGFGTGAYGPGDCCEKYTMGPMVDDAAMDADPAYYRAPEAELFFAENIFPDLAFKRTWETYYQRVDALAGELMGAVRTVLGYPADQWRELTDRPVSVMRFLRYPPIFAPEQRLSPHYDDDLITILHQSPTANGFDGLEVMLPGKSEWHSVPADDEMFVVNVGETLTYLTGGRVVSTKHRVASPPENLVKGSARSSVIHFYQPNWNARLRPADAAAMDHRLGLSAPSFHLEELQEPDGSVLFYKLLERAIGRIKGMDI